MFEQIYNQTSDLVFETNSYIQVHSAICIFCVLYIIAISVIMRFTQLFEDCIQRTLSNTTTILQQLKTIKRNQYCREEITELELANEKAEKEIKKHLHEISILQKANIRCTKKMSRMEEELNQVNCQLHDTKETIKLLSLVVTDISGEVNAETEEYLEQIRGILNLEVEEENELRELKNDPNWEPKSDLSSFDKDDHESM